MSRTGQSGDAGAVVRALEALPQPIHGYAADYPAGHVIPPHHHRRAQLIHAESGVMTVHTDAGAWLVPPGLAVWMPAGTTHQVRAVTAIRMCTLYIAADAAPWLPRDCRVVAVPPLLRELIRRAAAISHDYTPDGPDGRLMAVTLDQIRDLPAAPLHLPMPRDRRVLAVAEALLRNPGDTRELEAWARTAGASARTLARLFLAETGLSFGQWRQRRRLLAALTRLAAGEPVTSVALDLGYASPSAFTAMFRRELGTAPTRYLRPDREREPPRHITAP